MRSSVRCLATLAACCALALSFSVVAVAQAKPAATTYYTYTYLASNLSGKAKYTSSLLQNAWGTGVSRAIVDTYERLCSTSHEVP